MSSSWRICGSNKVRIISKLEYMTKFKYIKFCFIPRGSRQFAILSCTKINDIVLNVDIVLL